jgi:hypothetical protein
LNELTLQSDGVRGDDTAAVLGQGHAVGQALAGAGRRIGDHGTLEFDYQICGRRQFGLGYPHLVVRPDHFLHRTPVCKERMLR